MAHRAAAAGDVVTINGLGHDAVSHAPRRLSAAPGDGVASPALVSFAGIPVFIDRPRGFVQQKRDAAGKLLWERTYQVDYGFIPGTAGGDGEPLDVFLGPDPAQPVAWWANQVRDDGSPDEMKLLLGFADDGAARACYVAHIPERYLGSMAAGSVEQIRALVGVSPWATLATKPADASMPPWLAPASTRTAMLGSPDQPRNKDGEWTSGPRGAGGSSGDAGSSGAGGTSGAASADGADAGSAGDDSSDVDDDGIGATKSKTHERAEAAEKKLAEKESARAKKAEEKAHRAEAKASEARAKSTRTKEEHERLSSAHDAAEEIESEKETALEDAKDALAEAKAENARKLDPDDPEDVREEHPPIATLEKNLEAAKAEHREAVKAKAAAEKAYDAAEAKAERLSDAAEQAEDAAFDARFEATGARANADRVAEHAEMLGGQPKDYLSGTTKKATDADAVAKRSVEAARGTKAALDKAQDDHDAARSAYFQADHASRDAAEARWDEAKSRLASADEAHLAAERRSELDTDAFDYWDERARDARETISGFYDDYPVDGDGDGRTGAAEEQDDEEELSAARGADPEMVVSLSSLPPWLAPVKLSAPRGPVILADRGRSPLGPAVSGQLYLDRVVDRGLDAAPGALRETLAAAMAAIEGAKSYAEVAERLVELAPGAVERSQDFASLVEGAVMLGVGAGAWAVGEEADAS